MTVARQFLVVEEVVGIAFLFGGILIYGLLLLLCPHRLSRSPLSPCGASSPDPSLAKHWVGI
jgi:hypothetical protein